MFHHGQQYASSVVKFPSTLYSARHRGLYDFLHPQQLRVYSQCYKPFIGPGHSVGLLKKIRRYTLVTTNTLYEVRIIQTTRRMSTISFHFGHRDLYDAQV